MKVYELLRDRQMWTKGYYAFTGDGLQCSAFDPNATCFCLVGAVVRCYGDPPLDVEDGSMYGAWNGKVHAVLNRIESHLHTRGDLLLAQPAARWNDKAERQHEEVLALCQELDI